MEDLPELPLFNEARGADQIIHNLWMRDIPIETEPVLPFKEKSEKEQKRIAQRNEMLFDGLMEHTHDLINWKFFETWKKDWNGCIYHMEKLRVEAGNIINTILRDQPDFLTKTKGIYTEESVKKMMADGVFEAIWRGITEYGTEKIVIKVMSVTERHRTMGRPVASNDYEILFGREPVTNSVRLPNSVLAREGANICRRAANNLVKHSSIDFISDLQKSLKADISQLENILNPLRLHPIILRTRRNLCPV